MTDSTNIRNFSIIAHIDHGKSTLADRLLEVTGTIEKRKMKEQVLDSMELERERGITIKMQPVRMSYTLHGAFYELNLIDTPGHIDFSYEVSRAQKAVEGAILLVDATQGVQAQTLTTLQMAKDAGLAIIPTINKVDSPLARIPETKAELSRILGCSESDILEVSGKTGQGVEGLLKAIIDRVPPPKKETEQSDCQALVFDFQYSNHRGIVVYVRVFKGEVKKGDQLIFKVADRKFSALEVGTFNPEETPTESLKAGEIGYIVTGIKEAGVASVGDTIAGIRDREPALAGYMQPKPVVWASIYPESQDDFNLLRQALERLRLSDAAFSFEEESSGILGRGFRCGFLGVLHLEIITERLRREFNLELIVTLPSITYKLLLSNKKEEMVYTASRFPEDHLIDKVYEPWVAVRLIAPAEYVGSVMPILYDHEATVVETHNFSDNRTELSIEMPLRELMRNFFDEVKSLTSGYASISYEMLPLREADVVRLDMLVADEVVPAFSKVVSRRRAQEEAETGVEKLYKHLPRQLFATKIQGKAMGRILSSRTLSALKKDVTGYLYGGDISRKKKLWEQQKEGKKRLKERGKGNVNIPHDVFLKMMKSSE